MKIKIIKKQNNRNKKRLFEQQSRDQDNGWWFDSELELWRPPLALPKAPETPPDTFILGTSNGKGPRKPVGSGRRYAPIGVLVNGIKLEEDPEKWILADKTGETHSGGERDYGLRHHGTPELIKTIKSGINRVWKKGDDFFTRALILDLIHHEGPPPAITSPEAQKIFKHLFSLPWKDYQKLNILTDPRFKDLTGDDIRLGRARYNRYMQAKKLGLLNNTTRPVYIEDLSPSPTEEEEINIAGEEKKLHWRPHTFFQRSYGHGSHQTGEDVDISMYMHSGMEATQETNFLAAYSPGIGARVQKQGGQNKRGTNSKIIGRDGRYKHQKSPMDQLRDDEGRKIRRYRRRNPDKKVNLENPTMSLKAHYTAILGREPLDCDPMDNSPCPPGEVCINDVCVPIEQSTEDYREISQLSAEITKKEKISNTLERLLDLPPEKQREIIEKFKNSFYFGGLDLGSHTDISKHINKEIRKVHEEIDGLKVQLQTILDKTPGLDDVDFYKLVRKSNVGLRKAIYDQYIGSMDPHRTWQLIKGCLDAGFVKSILLDRSLHNPLRRAAMIAGDEYPSNIIKHWPRHLNHLHIRVDARHSRDRGKKFWRTQLRGRDINPGSWRVPQDKRSKLLMQYLPHAKRTADRNRRPSPAPGLTP